MERERDRPLQRLYGERERQAIPETVWRDRSRLLQKLYGETETVAGEGDRATTERLQSDTWSREETGVGEPAQVVSSHIILTRNNHYNVSNKVAIEEPIYNFHTLPFIDL